MKNVDRIRAVWTICRIDNGYSLTTKLLFALLGLRTDIGTLSMRRCNSKELLVVRNQACRINLVNALELNYQTTTSTKQDGSCTG
jgi:hypothetical protein